MWCGMDRDVKRKIFGYLLELTHAWDGSYESLLECLQVLRKAEQDDDISPDVYTYLIGHIFSGGDSRVCTK